MNKPEPMQSWSGSVIRLYHQMTGYIFNLVVHIDLSLAFSLVLTISKASMKFPNASVLNVILCLNAHVPTSLTNLDHMHLEKPTNQFIN